MQSFVKAAILLATLGQVVLALPGTAEFSGKAEVDAQETSSSPSHHHHHHVPDAAVSASRPFSATGAKGGQNTHGNGANGGQVTVGKREEDFFFPIFRPTYVPAAVNGPITANGANGGYNYGGNGANGGYIGINRREEGSEEFLFPLRPWYHIPRLPINGAISANGANGGYNYNGDGANGGAIDINRRGDEFLWPLFRPAYYQPGNGPITATGANGGYNYGGNGANGGSISVNRREEESSEALLPLTSNPLLNYLANVGLGRLY